MFPKETRILLVDDMTSIRDLVRSQLRSMGYNDIIECANGEDAFNALERQSQSSRPVGLVISDWNMPVMTGLELLKKARSQPQYASLPIILLTSESERDQVTEAVLSGVSQYVVKPFSGKIFEEKMRGAWQKHNKS